MTLWLMARSMGLAALVLLSLSICLGALMTSRGSASGRVVWHYVHRVCASLGLGVLVLHISTIIADPYAHVGWSGALVPFTAGYRPAWVGLGTLAAYVFVLTAALGAARGHFAGTPRGAATWRGLHSLAYLGWAMAMWHGFFAGSDSSLTWVRMLYVSCGVAVIGSLLVRLTRVNRPGLVRHRAPISGAPTPALVGAR
jgi:hypothetical protein